MNRRRDLAGWFALGAGLGDLGTGVALIAAPQLVLRGLALPAVAEPVLLRFVGVFVASVGAAYFWPFLGAPHDLAGRLRATFALTALPRLAVAGFLDAAVAAGALAPPWLMVGGYDAVIALVQLRLRPDAASGVGR